MSMNDSFGIEKMFHLVGEQPLPPYIISKQFGSSRILHYLLTTEAEKTKLAASRIRDTMEANGMHAKILFIGKEKDAVSIRKLHESIFEALEQEKCDMKKAGFDLTGGTKLMAFAAYTLCSELGIHPFYLDTKGRTLQNLSDETRNQPLVNMLSIPEFISLSGLRTMQSTKWESSVSRETLERLFRERTILQRYQRQFAECVNNKKTKPNDYEVKTLFDPPYWELKSELGDRMNLDSIWEQSNNKPKYADRAAYLAGVWFEDYVYNLILGNKAVKERNVAKNLEVIFPDTERTAQEFDVIYTDGLTLIILECKAGKIEQEHITKLEMLKNNFSGALGKSALVSLNGSSTSNNLKESFVSRIKNSSGVAAFCGDRGLTKLNESVFGFSPGKIYE